jgi:hypothetical protein
MLEEQLTAQYAVADLKCLSVQQGKVGAFTDCD